MKKVMIREEIPVELTWDLSKMYKNDAEFEADFIKLAPMCTELENLKGLLLDSPENLLTCMLDLLTKSFLTPTLYYIFSIPWSLWALFWVFSSNRSSNSFIISLFLIHCY